MNNSNNPSGNTVTESFFDRIKLWLLDMDGTIYLGDALIEGAEVFVQSLVDRKKDFLFLTNNSSKSASAYIQKLHALGLTYIHEDRIFTSGQATVSYLKRNYMKKAVYLLGTPTLQQEFIDHEIALSNDPEVVVIGFDTTLTYEKLHKVCDLVRDGLPYIATHPDYNCPTANGFMPDIGAIIAFIKASTDREPDVIIGKPYLPMLQAIQEIKGCALHEMVMVGDRLYTDIAMGAHGIRTILTLSGETTPQDLNTSEFHPDMVVRSVADLSALI